MHPRLAAAAELAALSGAALAVPLLDVFGRAPEVFVGVGADRTNVWAFGVLVAFAPLAIMAAAEFIVGAVFASAARAMHHAFVGGLVVAIALPILRDGLAIEGLFLLIVAVGIGIGAAIAMGRWQPLRTGVGYAAPLPLVALVLFTSLAPTSTVGRSPAAIARVAPPARPAPVVMIVLDEFPVSTIMRTDGTIDADRFPGFAELAANSRWFRNATTVAARTEQAVPAIVTGRDPDSQVRAPDRSQYPDNLLRLLAGSATVHGDEVLTDLCEDERCPDPSPAGGTVRTSNPNPLPRLLHDLGDVAQRRWSLDPATDVPEAQLGEIVERQPSERGPRTELPRFEAFLDSMTETDSNPVHFLHLLAPHAPWRTTADGLEYDVDFDDPAIQFPGYDGVWSSQTAADAARVRLVSQAGFVDTLVARMLDRLRTTGLWDRAIVVIVADHGNSLLAGSPGRAIRSGANDLMGIPLFVRAPGLEPGVDDRPSRITDITPTIADLLGLELPWSTDGISLLDAPRTDTSSHIAIGAVGTAPKIVEVDLTDHVAALRRRANPEPDAPVDPAHRQRAFSALGPDGALVGDSIDEHPDLVNIAVRLEHPTREAFAQVVDNRPWPLLVVGHVDGEPGRPIYVIVNDTIAGTAVTFTDRSHRARFATLIDPAALRDGSNQVEFFTSAQDAGSDAAGRSDTSAHTAPA